MKRKVLRAALAACLLCLALAGCSARAATPESTLMARPSPSQSEAGIDVDLTQLGANMVYAQVSNMMQSPDNYLGKTIRMSGPYYSYYFDQTKNVYHYVIIEDAAACCAQGLEFIWNGEHLFPEDYPPDDARVEMTGVYNKYEELGITYYYLAVDDVIVLEEAA